MDDAKAVEAVARALCEPLGYTKQAANNWEGVWVGSVADSPETGSLAYLCRSLARAAIATLRPLIEEERWQPIETAPKVGAFLAYCEDGDFWLLQYSVEDNGFYTDDCGEKVFVPCATHWQQLPEPPAAIREQADGG